MSILQELYDSEINAKIEWFWDNGFEVMLGDEMNGYVAHERLDDFSSVEDWLECQAIKHYPESVFAQARKTPTLAGNPEKLEADVCEIISSAKM